MAIGPGSHANGANGHKGGLAIGPGSQANGGGLALNGGDTHPGCNVAIDHQCFNQPGK